MLKNGCNRTFIPAVTIALGTEKVTALQLLVMFVSSAYCPPRDLAAHLSQHFVMR
jgi:hypothetical protein